jgi:hypothetical protein
MTMPSMIATARWRRLAASLVALSLFTAFMISLTGLISAKSRPASAASAPPQVYQPSGQGTARAHGAVDLSKLPTITPQDGASAQAPVAGAQQAQQLAQQLPASGATVGSQNFVGGGAIPVLGKQFDGLNSTQAGGGKPTMAIATDVNNVMQGTTNAIAVYSAATGATLGGPYTAQSFFAPVYHSGDFFLDPQMYFDVMRRRWIVAYLEYASDRLSSYLDVAVSQTTSPTQQYNIYQFATDFRSNIPYDSCAVMTLGVDYWGIYLSCQNVDYLDPIGNTVLAIDKAPMLTGASNPKTWYWNDRVTIADNSTPARYISPTIVEGQQDAEFVVAIDMGSLSASSSNLTVCAVTNQRTMASAEPVFSCQHTSLGYTYSDPIRPRLPGGTVLLTWPGLKQVYYKAGHLFLAWASALKGQDVIDYAEIRPILRQQTPPPPPTGPLLMYGVEVVAAGTGSLSLPNQDLYDPAIVGTAEDDIVLVFNSSGPTTNPRINYTGRKATDPNAVMGQGISGIVTFVTDVSATTTTWSEYAACAISLDAATRGSVWCASQYFRPGAGWFTRLYNLRAE